MLQEPMGEATDPYTEERTPGHGVVEHPQCSSARTKFDVRIAKGCEFNFEHESAKSVTRRRPYGEMRRKCILEIIIFLNIATKFGHDTVLCIGRDQHSLSDFGKRTPEI